MSTIESEFYHIGVSPYIAKRLSWLVDEGWDYCTSHFQDEVVRQGGRYSYEIQEELNKYERAHPRRDPSMKGMRTDKWIFLFKNKARDQWRQRNNRIGFTCEYNAVNMQKPFIYKLKVMDHGVAIYDIKYGNVFMSEYPDDPNAPLGYIQHVKSPFHYNPKIAGYKAEYDKVGYRGKGKIGNLAAVRLAQGNGYVYAGSYKTNSGKRVVSGRKGTHDTGKDIDNQRNVGAKRLIFWVHGVVRNPNGKGRPINIGNSGGYVFSTKRKYAGKGHMKYRQDIENILNISINRYLGDIA